MKSRSRFYNHIIIGEKSINPFDVIQNDHWYFLLLHTHIHKKNNPPKNNVTKPIIPLYSSTESENIFKQKTVSHFIGNMCVIKSCRF